MEFADKKFWELIADDLASKTGLGQPSGWKKSMIENFVFDFLDDLEVICAQSEKKAVQCNVPMIKNEFAYNQLTFSYDSFRRIFITRESKGSKTTKNMFAIYLGYDSYIDFWVKARERQEPKVTTLSNGKEEERSQLHNLCLDRIKGGVKVDKKLYQYIQQSQPDSDIALVELMIHFFAKYQYKKPKYFEAIEAINYKPLSLDFAKRAMAVLECIQLLESGDKKAISQQYHKVKSYSNISLQQSSYLAFWEGLILLACEKYEACDSVWKKLSGYYPFTKFDNYPFVRHTRPFDRVIFKVILGEDNIDEIVSQLDLSGFKGLAHLSAVNCKIIRKCEYLLHNLIQLGEVLKWKKIPDFQMAWKRLLLFEKQVLSNSGTLL